MNWRSLFEEFLCVATQRTWLIVCLLLFLDNCSEVKPHPGETDHLTISSSLVSHEILHLPTNRPIKRVDKTNNATAMSLNNLASSQPAVLSKSERIRRKKERKLKRLQKQREKMSRSKAKGYKKSAQTKILESTITEGKTYKPEDNVLRTAMDHAQIKTMAENDVLGNGKTDKFNPASRDLYSKMLELESKLLNEIIRNRDAHSTLVGHTGRLDHLNSTAVEYELNVTMLQTQVNTIEKLLKSQDVYHHSIEHKLSGVMLDISEASIF